MRLAEFILDNREAIAAEWEAFAATLLPAASSMVSLALRDHVQEILEAIARDLSTSQTRQEQSEKSKGRAPQVAGAPDTAAQTHAVLRAQSGFNINQLVAEYRALRASVLRLRMDHAELGPPDTEDVIRKRRSPCAFRENRNRLLPLPDKSVPFSTWGRTCRRRR